MKIKNKIEFKQKIQQQFSKGISFDTALIELGAGDKSFIDRTIECIENNISDSSFNVDRLCEEVGISHPQMYRKIKALTNLSIAGYIRKIRLKKAASILRESNEKISDIAYLVGFSDPNYFTKCFIKEYGQSPKDFKR